MVGYVSHTRGAGVRCPIWGISAKRALWLLNFVGVVVVVVGGVCCAFVCMRINQWSRGVCFGIYVGVHGSPRCLSQVAVMRSARGL